MYVLLAHYDETVGEEAKKLHDDGVALLQEIVKNKTLKAKGVVGIFPACSVGDDIDVYDATGSTKKGTFHGLRQQEEREDTTYLAISDFIAPESAGVRDYIGAFAVSCGFGCEGVRAPRCGPRRLSSRVSRGDVGARRCAPSCARRMTTTRAS